jgi:broad specificity phosphatase PhoE
MRATSRVLDDNPTGKVLVVAHAGTCGTMLRGILRTQALIVRTDLAALHGLSWENGLWNLQFTNRQEHLNAAARQNHKDLSV